MQVKGLNSNSARKPFGSLHGRTFHSHHEWTFTEMRSVVAQLRSTTLGSYGSGRQVVCQWWPERDLVVDQPLFDDSGGVGWWSVVQMNRLHG
jgi:hypothetical protein